mmetsp:Transcript_2135/g.4765  ORF Transcript_2135/g.4765 Transcript_2135/m.4765 type:complete len:234 (-) Transcript_2135:698-1399(-)
MPRRRLEPGAAINGVRAPGPAWRGHAAHPDRVEPAAEPGEPVGDDVGHGGARVLHVGEVGVAVGRRGARGVEVARVLRLHADQDVEVGRQRHPLPGEPEADASLDVDLGHREVARPRVVHHDRGHDPVSHKPSREELRPPGGLAPRAASPQHAGRAVLAGREDADVGDLAVCDGGPHHVHAAGHAGPKRAPRPHRSVLPHVDAEPCPHAGEGGVGLQGDVVGEVRDGVGGEGK